MDINKIAEFNFVMVSYDHIVQVIMRCICKE